MFLLVTGGSGKSEYAESRVLEWKNEKRYYIATMMCFDEESKKRVERHRKMRAGKGFETVEQYLNLKELELPARNSLMDKLVKHPRGNVPEDVLASLMPWSETLPDCCRKTKSR